MLLNPTLVDYLGKCVDLNDTQNAIQLHNARMPEGRMQIRPEAAHFLCFLLRLITPKHILEIGTYTGFSALSFALHTDENCTITAVDRNAEWTKLAKRYWKEAGVDHRIRLVLGDACAVLPTLTDLTLAGFDFIFIDADKRSYQDYLNLCLDILAPGGCIVIDNVLWRGDVSNADTRNVNTQVLRAFNDYVFNRDDLMTSVLPLGDGLMLVQKRV